MSEYIKREDAIRKRAEEMASASYWEYVNPQNADEWLEVAEMEFEDLPTIIVPKIINGVVLKDCDKVIVPFLEEHECDELWEAVRALRDFYDCVTEEERIDK